MFSHNIKKKLIPYLDGELNRAERSQVEKHLAVCAQCRREMEYLRTLTSALRCAAPEVEPEPVDLWSQVQTQITKVPQRSASWLSNSRLQMAGAVAAVLVVVVVGLGMIGMFGETSKFSRSPVASMPPGMGGPPMPPSMGAPGGPPMGPGMTMPGMPGSPPMPGRARMGKTPAAQPAPGAPWAASDRTMSKPAMPGAIAPIQQMAKSDPLKNKLAKNEPPPAGHGYRSSGESLPPDSALEEKPVALSKSAEVRVAPSAVPGAPGSPAAPPGPPMGGMPGALSPAADMAIEKDKNRSVARPGMPMNEASPEASATAKESQIEDMQPSQWRKMAQEARREGKTRELAQRFEASFRRTNRPDIGLFLLDIWMNPIDKAGLIRTADALSRLGSSSQSFWLRVGQAYEIAGKLNAAQSAYGKALVGGDTKTSISARAKLDKVRQKKQAE